MRRILPVICSVVFLAGCSSNRTELRNPSVDEKLEVPKLSYESGSIWQASSGSLTEDPKARRKGDTLTILITESASASKEASTKTGRRADMQAGVPNLLGLETNMTGVSKWMDLSKLINASSESSYDGSGSTARKENLNATITAKVIEVLPNGNFQIEGRRNVRVNNEDQIILLEGTVRPRDISADNMVNSGNVANAKITYSGKGIISDRQQPGWLMNILDKIWPF